MKFFIFVDGVRRKSWWKTVFRDSNSVVLKKNAHNAQSRYSYFFLDTQKCHKIISQNCDFREKMDQVCSFEFQFHVSWRVKTKNTPITFSPKNLQNSNPKHEKTFQPKIPNRSKVKKNKIFCVWFARDGRNVDQSITKRFFCV